MLTIPNSIKNLYRTDGTRKNFRVHFPGGELPDITNDNIVRESVHFTESICSQSTFRFGLAEASVIEFETVGIGNMYGMTIECAYEIDTSSLSASEIASIQSDPGDGELVLASASDIGYGFYRVPLGVFRVERCPRNHGAMTHRQVTAYQYPNVAAISLAPPEEAIFYWATSNPSDVFYRYTTENIDLIPFVFANLGYFTPASILKKYSRAAIASESGMTTATYTNTSWSITDTDSNRYRFSVSVTGLETEAVADVDTIHGYVAPVMDYDAITAYAEQIAKQYISNQESASHLAAGALLYAGVRHYVQRLGSPRLRFVIPQNSVYSFYPLKDYLLTPSGQAFYNFPTSITLTLERYTSGSWAAVDQQTFTASTSTCTLYEFTPLSSLPSIIMTTDLQNVSSLLANLTSGLYELLGEFGKADRLGGIEDFALSPSSPLSISPGDYDECWWDEYDVSPIGTVTVTYRNGEEGEATANVTLGAGASLYDMTDNEVLKNLSTADLDSITTLLSGDFATNAENVGFTPVELTMQGWPWMEAGDALQITAEDGTVVNTYALRVEMSGIQHLMSDITAEGGEIIGEV